MSSSTAGQIPGAVKLSYDLHSPAKPVTNQHVQPIIFLHGLFGSKKNNRSISRALARDLGRYVYAPDARNHGDSPHNPRHDYNAMADDLENFIHEHKLKDVTLIGHSMGAKTAMTLALRRPELLRDVIPVDNAPIDAGLVSYFGTYTRAMKEIDRAGVSRHSDADKILEAYEPSLPVRQFLLGNLHRVHVNGHNVLRFRVPIDILGKALDNMGDFPFQDPQTARFEKPALFVRGSHSKYVPDEVLPVIGQFFPLFQLVDVDAGHWLISEQPEQFRQAVVQFLAPKD
ncbi:alpha beta hydrolase fold family [Grosmannia clavigera kw1407]|uniref:Alpha beta hydrolase fold family n=1 Tax=Grosmannia clavigera (strain kw1407 / UAMH 11150) TaxID=655863 RepID=F0XM17_GROCL|nr:alpha beta hydrolase fold family [Grosmannia clavigera kw1407]EFX01046.1 alpha beta hydrolase fold family [Grosmannia clavigera kw1407]